MVIVVGSDPTAVKRCTCLGCASILEYTKSEIQSRQVRDYTGCVDTYYAIVCPRCGQDVMVNRY